MVSSGLNALVLANGADWLVGPPIILKYIVTKEKSPFHNVAISLDKVPFVTHTPSSKDFDTFSLQILKVMECTILDTFVNLPLPSASAALWAVGWNSNFVWGDSFSGRCSIEWHYDFVQLLSIIFEPGPCNIRDFSKKMVSSTASHS
jgi:hypothetical protein